MRMVPVTSSNVSHIGHDPGSNTMQVQYKSGHVYTFHGVSAEEHQRVMGSSSIGKAVNRVTSGKPSTRHVT